MGATESAAAAMTVPAGKHAAVMKLIAANVMAVFEALILALILALIPAAFAALIAAVTRSRTFCSCVVRSCVFLCMAWKYKTIVHCWLIINDIGVLASPHLTPFTELSGFNHMVTYPITVGRSRY